MRKIINIVTIILSVFLLCSTVFASGEAIRHDLRVTKDGAGDYILTSMTQEQFEYDDRMVLLSCVFACRKDGKWDNEFPIVTRRSHKDPLIVEAVKNLDFLTYICDKAVPDERVMALCYYADYSELVIYLHPDQQEDEAIHQEVADKINRALNER